MSRRRRSPSTRCGADARNICAFRSAKDRLVDFERAKAVFGVCDESAGGLGEVVVFGMMINWRILQVCLS